MSASGVGGAAQAAYLTAAGTTMVPAADSGAPGVGVGVSAQLQLRNSGWQPELWTEELEGVWRYHLRAVRVRDGARLGLIVELDKMVVRTARADVAAVQLERSWAELAAEARRL